MRIMVAPAGKLAMLIARTVSASRELVMFPHGNLCIAQPSRGRVRSILATGVAIILILFLFMSMCLPSVSGQMEKNPIIDKPAVGKEVVSLRTEYSKTYHISGDHYQIVSGGGIVHWKNNYDNPDEPWQDPELVWHNGWLTQAPYILVDKGGWYSFTDRKTGEITTIEPLTVSTSKGGAIFKVVPFVDGVSFQYTINADQLPFEAKYKVEGDAVITSRAWDDAGELELTTTFKNGILTESMTTTKDKITKEYRAINGTIRIDPTTTVQPPTKDDLLATDGANHGALILLAVARDPGMATWTYYRTIIHLDMPADPGGTVNNVTMYMYKYVDVAGYGCSAVECHELTQTAWVEMEATWTVYSAGNNWANPGTDYDAAVIDLTNNVQPFGTYGWEHWVINGTVADNPLELDWTDEVHLLMKYPEVASKMYTQWYSKDYGVDPAKRPYLLIDYTAYSLPELDLFAATDIGQTTATVSGNITSLGGAPDCTDRGFGWNITSGSPYAYNWTETGSFSTGVYAYNITGLTPDTLYYCSAFGVNSVGLNYSAEGNFTTLMPLPLAPTNFQAEQTGINQVTLNWTMGLYATNTTIRARENDPPTSRIEGYEVYTGNGTSVNVTMAINEHTTYGFSAWSVNPIGYSIGYATTTIGGTMILLMIIGILALGLTVAMFTTRNSLLGFPSGIFWAVFGGACYLNSTATWDIYYLLFFASMGMVIATIFGAFSLRHKDLAGPDADEGAFIDEDGHKVHRPQVIEVPRRQGAWGDIDRLGMSDTEDEGYRSEFSERLHTRLDNHKQDRHLRTVRRREEHREGL